MQTTNSDIIRSNRQDHFVLSPCLARGFLVSLLTGAISVSPVVGAQSAPPDDSSEGARASEPPPSSPDGAARSAHAHHRLFIDSNYRSPGLAVALSLSPLPVDFGNFYAENLGWGMGYTVAEVFLMTPMMWFAGGHMGHGSGETRRWSDGERHATIALLSGYVAVKLIAGVHAGFAARDFNRPQSAVAYAGFTPLTGGGVGEIGLYF